MSISTALLRKKDHATEAWSLTALAKCCRDLSMNTLHRENKFFAISIHIFFIHCKHIWQLLHAHLYSTKFLLVEEATVVHAEQVYEAVGCSSKLTVEAEHNFFYHTLKYEKPLKRNMQPGNPCRIVFNTIAFLVPFKHENFGLSVSAFKLRFLAKR